MRWLALTSCGIVLLASAPVFAQIPDDRAIGPPAGEVRQHGANTGPQLRHAMRTEVNAGLVSIMSRGMEGTELWEATDLAASLGLARDHLRVLPIAGKGGLQNATDIVFARGVDIGIVQSDVLAALKRDPPFPGIENYLQYITKLYDEEVHILAGTQIQSIEDLASKKVNLGVRDSGTSYTAKAIFDALGIRVEATNFAQPVALDKLRRGEISAMVCLTPKPARLFQDLRPDENLHFLPIKATSNLPQSYTSAVLTTEDYPELIEADAPVSTVAVGTILAAYNWPTETDRYRKVQSFVQAFFAHLRDMQAPPHHPKWRQIDLGASVPGWTRFSAAEEWMRKAGLDDGEPRSASPRYAAVAQGSIASLSAQGRDALFKEFVDFQKREPHQEANRAGPLDLQERDSLFREFSEYQKQQSRAASTEQPVPKHFAELIADQKQ